MRSKVLVATILALMLALPVQAGSGFDAMQQQNPNDDPRQPNEGNVTYRIWSDDSDNQWGHFDSNDTSNVEENLLSESRENGKLEIDFKFLMEPTLVKRLFMEVDSEIKGNFKIALAGHWDNNVQGPCQSNQRDCENLNITLYRGASEVWRQEYAGLTDGEQTVTFNYRVTEDHTTWDANNDNIQLRFEMVLRGDYSESGWPITQQSGEEAQFTIYLSGDNSSTLEFPVSPDSWAEDFQEGGEIGGGGSEDSPGFTVVIASAAIVMAAVWSRPSRKSGELTEDTGTVE